MKWSTIALVLAAWLGSCMAIGWLVMGCSALLSH